MKGYPIHHCHIDNPCPILIGRCEGKDPSKWTRPAWLRVLHIDEGHLSRRNP